MSDLKISNDETAVEDINGKDITVRSFDVEDGSKLSDILDYLGDTPFILNVSFGNRKNSSEKTEPDDER